MLIFVHIADITKSETQRERSSSIDDETLRKLEKQIAHRPEKSELVDRNILKGRWA